MEAGIKPFRAQAVGVRRIALPRSCEGAGEDGLVLGMEIRRLGDQFENGRVHKRQRLGFSTRLLQKLCFGELSAMQQKMILCFIRQAQRPVNLSERVLELPVRWPAGVLA